MLVVQLQARTAQVQLPGTSNSWEPLAHFKTRTTLVMRTTMKKTLAKKWGCKSAPSTTKVMRSLKKGTTAPLRSSSA